jgi:hypothetical protein
MIDCAQYQCTSRNCASQFAPLYRPSQPIPEVASVVRVVAGHLGGHEMEAPRQSDSNRRTWPRSAAIALAIGIVTFVFGATPSGLLALQSLMGSAADPIRTVILAIAIVMIVFLPLAVRHLNRRDETSIVLSDGLPPEHRPGIAIELARRLRTVCRTALGLASIMCLTFLLGLIVQASTGNPLITFQSKWRVADKTFSTLFPRRDIVTGEIGAELRIATLTNLAEYDTIISTYGGMISQGDLAKLLGKKAVLQIMLGDRGGAADTTKRVGDLGAAGEKVNAYLTAYLFVGDAANENRALPPSIGGSLSLATPFARILQAERFLCADRAAEALPLVSSFVDEFRASAKFDARIAGYWAEASAIKLAAMNKLGRHIEVLKLSDEGAAHCRRNLAERSLSFHERRQFQNALSLSLMERADAEDVVGDEHTAKALRQEAVGLLKELIATGGRTDLKDLLLRHEDLLHNPPLRVGAPR